MFLSRELNVISGKKSISAKQLNDAIDSVGLPFGFQYSKRFLLYGIRTVHQVEVVSDKAYRVPSESKAGICYNVTLDPLFCECPAFYRFKVTPYPFCKHIVAAMVKEQDVTDAFFDWQILKGKNGVGSMDAYIQARFISGTANISILEPLPELPSFSWEVAYQKCCEVVGAGLSRNVSKPKKAIVNILINDLVNWGKLRQASLGEYNRAEWILIYDWCQKEAQVEREEKSLNRWSYNSAVFLERCREAIAGRRRRVVQEGLYHQITTKASSSQTHRTQHRTLVREK